MKKHILLVEDDNDTTELMQQQLEHLGYEFTVARNGAEAVQMATVQLPDLIIMDIRMPKMDGLQAVSQIRNDPKTHATRILAATVLAMPGDRERCLASGCNDYIAKPFTLRQLGAALKKLLKVD